LFGNDHFFFGNDGFFFGNDDSSSKMAISCSKRPVSSPEIVHSVKRCGAFLTGKNDNAMLAAARLLEKSFILSVNDW
jgi:hypothetical protein